MNDFLNYASAVLGPKEVRQFKNAIEHPMGEFHKRVIAPQFFQPRQNLYLGVALDKFARGKNHYLAQTMLQHANAWQALTYFTNPLAIPPSPVMVDGKEKWVAPKDRVIWGQHQVMTYEFDESNLSFFKRQMAWCRSRNGKLLNCDMGQLYKACSQWSDFAGLTVNYSGNKSFHIHIVFATGHAKAIGIEQHIREGLDTHWHRLLDTVMTTLKPGMTPDRSMSQPDKYRRIPNGVRKLDAPNLLGIPAGKHVPQVTIWEKFRDRMAKGANKMFFDPSQFVPRAIERTTRPGKSLTFLPSGEELDFCRGKMLAIFDDQNYPAFHDFLDHEGGIRAHFTNHAGDRNPSSYMDADYRTVNIIGSNPLGLAPSTAPSLPKPLGEMMADWVSEFQALNTRPRTPVEQAFAVAVVDDVSARSEMAALLMKVIRADSRALICAPEGISKTTGLFDNHARIDRWLRTDGTGSVMYAFADYNSAKDKATEFNDRQDARYRAVVLDSFDRAYEVACKDLGLVKLGTADILKVGQNASLWDAIGKLQPEIFAAFRERHAEIWDEVGDATPVFFVVHAVAHNWRFSSKSRQMWAPSFWTLQGRKEHASVCRKETKISLLVHDEVRADNLIAAYPAVKVDWVEAMIVSNPRTWRSSTPAHYRRSAFEVRSRLQPCAREISFEEAQDIAAFSGHEWDRVVTLDSGEYGDLGGAYAEAIGNAWCIIERPWSVETANKTIVLTTETVPLEVARRAEQEWAIYDLDTPRISQDTVEIRAPRGVKGEKLPKLYAKWREEHPDDWIVGNKVGELDRTMTHAAARGSNKLIGRDVMQTMTFMTPEELEKQEALNAWTGLDSLVRHRHIDEFNQTAGRNLGFRKRGEVRHTLVVNQRLRVLLNGAPLARCRYGMQFIPTKHQHLKSREEQVASSSRKQPINLDEFRRKLVQEYGAIREELCHDDYEGELPEAA
jgi:hypothetical protein